MPKILSLNKYKQGSNAKAPKPVKYDDEFNSLLLEKEVRAALDIIGMLEKIKTPILIAHINYRKQPNVSLANACQVFVISYLLQKPLSPHNYETLKSIIHNV